MTAPGEVSLRVDKVSFRYRKRLALDAITCELPGGALGIVGPNGAGKSTLLSVIATLAQPSSGKVFICGTSVDRGSLPRVRQHIGYLPQRFTLVPHLTIEDTLRYAAWCQRLDNTVTDARLASTLSLVQLEDARHRKVGSLSGGQRQRVGIAASMIHDPDILLLDEPTSGLDPEIRLDLRRTLRRIADTKTVVLTSHLIDDIDHICPRVFVLDRGRLLFDGPTAQLKEEQDPSLPGSALEQGYVRVLRSANAA